MIYIIALNIRYFGVLCCKLRNILEHFPIIE